MANHEHLEILMQGAEQWNRWRKEHPDLRPDLGGTHLPDATLTSSDLSHTKLVQAHLPNAHLSGTNLSEADLRGANLSRASLGKANLARVNARGANLGQADLRGANLRGMNAQGANLSEAELNRADLYGARLSGANLRGANLVEAYLRWAILSDADLQGADLSRATVRNTNFCDLDLAEAKGLETIRHEGPSTVGIDTVYKSRGKIPEVFLRGCGVPDEFIAYIGSMVGRPIEFYSCFISYSTKDQDFAERLHADLQAKGVRCWFAPEEMKGGHKLHEQIDEAIRLHDKLLLILSEHSMSSPWVETEIANAREREKREDKQLLFPITLVPFEAIKQWKLFDADMGIDSAREIREYFIPDFSNWKDHDSYQTAFQRLVKDLKAGAGG
jgi:hypothetical protein